jgi:ABC-type transport system involved in cytochrome bd biosynthesis fused ATPase/permease subunit
MSAENYFAIKSQQGNIMGIVMTICEFVEEVFIRVVFPTAIIVVVSALIYILFR